MAMEETVRSNYLGAKYFVDNLKKDKIKILRGKFLAGYGVTLYEKSTVVKTYYDTPDCFFKQVGITININKLAGGKGELVVRFNTDANRIIFLNNIPDTFAKPVNPRSTAREHMDFIADAIYELIPNGISSDVQGLIRSLRPIIVKKKKRERYRIINANGFKTIMSFANCVYHNQINGIKKKVETLELESKSNNNEYFPVFQKLLTFEFPTLIATDSSDLTVGFDICVK